MLLHACKTARKALAWFASALAALPRQAATALGAPGTDGKNGQASAGQPHRLWQAMIMTLPIAALAAWGLPQLTIVMSPSIEAWLLRAAPGPIRLGDLVSFDLSHPVAGPRPVRVTKYALCFPGQRIDWVERPADIESELPRSLSKAVERVIWNGWYFCEGRLLGVSKLWGHDGRRLDHWRPTYTILPPGLIYVGSPHASGFDSRYYGPVSIARLKRMEKIL